MNSDYSRNPTGLHGSVNIGARLPTSPKTLSAARALGASQAAKTVGLKDEIAQLRTDRVGNPTTPAPTAQTLSQSPYTTTGSLTNPKVA